MDLWIWTQDKLNLEKTTAFEIDEQEEPVIYIRNFNGTLVFAGQYKNMERTLEVLGEIKKLLMPKFSVDVGSIKYEQTDQLSNVLNATCNCEVLQLNSYVYEMPKE